MNKELIDKLIEKLEDSKDYINWIIRLIQFTPHKREYEKQLTILVKEIKEIDEIIEVLKCKK